MVTTPKNIKTKYNIYYIEPETILTNYIKLSSKSNSKTVIYSAHFISQICSCIGININITTYRPIRLNSLC